MWQTPGSYLYARSLLKSNCKPMEKNQKIVETLRKVKTTLEKQRTDCVAQKNHILALLDLPEWVRSLGIEQFLLQELEKYKLAEMFCEDMIATIDGTIKDSICRK